MWPLVAALLLGTVCGGSAQLTFNSTRIVEKTICNETVVLPCIVSNLELRKLKAMYVKWKHKGKEIFTFDGVLNKSNSSDDFKSATIAFSHLTEGNASLQLKTSDAVRGNYTCEVTESNREGEIVVELRYHMVSWFHPKENILIVIFPILAILLFWGQFGIVTLKYKSNCTSEKTIGLIIAGLFLTVVVIVGAVLFVPGEYSVKNASGLGLIVIPTVTLVVLQYCLFTTAFGMSLFAIGILILQFLGYILAVIGLSLCITECSPTQGPLMISGLGIIALAELLGLVYMKFVASNQKTIPPSRKAVEEPLNVLGRH
ncbi:leukocyte surface antigen CD47 isoform X1 [Gracilinanus agilis]|uniref:leukocyte surface antigen CD47 isoform X1 n=1 Tax=Gracilinanus agilis TaxID=191870 RepID=UPI001CFCBE2B|nr:leukocyte surface antigen CD47 isoform X1 [Gracilinanus agilis]